VDDVFSERIVDFTPKSTLPFDFSGWEKSDWKVNSGNRALRLSSAADALGPVGPLSISSARTFSRRRRNSV
jgi:hypothetical protein